MTKYKDGSLTVISGEKFTRTGYWGYDGHILDLDCKAFVPDQENKMLYIRNEVAPKLGSCPHIIRWVFKGERQDR